MIASKKILFLKNYFSCKNRKMFVIYEYHPHGHKVAHSTCVKSTCLKP